MTIEEAIKHAEEVAEGHEKIKRIKAVTLEECKCAEEHRQLAEWLKELKQLREQVSSLENQNRWVPVSKRLPEKFRFVNCTCHSLIDDREDWVIETVYVPQPSNSPYSDWGNIPMLNKNECEVIAWVYRDIPEPYKASQTGAEGSEKK